MSERPIGHEDCLICQDREESPHPCGHEAEIASLREQLEAEGVELQGEWHAFSCHLRSNSIGIRWCTCEKARAALEAHKERAREGGQ